LAADVRASVDGFSPEMIKAQVAGRRPRWDAKSAGTKSLFANHLSIFAASIDIGDQVVTFDPVDRETVLIERVASARTLEAHRYNPQWSATRRCPRTPGSVDYTTTTSITLSSPRKSSPFRV
jgi:hypothetical protein